MIFPKKMPAILATATLALGLTACGGDSERTTVTEAATPATSITVVSTDTDNADDDKETTPSTATVPSHNGASVTIDGAAVPDTFAPVSCTNEEDDGQPELNIHAGAETPNDLEVEIIDPDDTPHLGGLSVESEGNREFELSDSQEAAATVKKSGSEWTITGEGTYDGTEGTALPFEVKVSRPASAPHQGHNAKTTSTTLERGLYKHPLSWVAFFTIRPITPTDFPLMELLSTNLRPIG
ncbi:hypothetical protein HMPREF1219_01322 [Corynebacterium pyruviciproducens ATCC BAA-1742]|uniref:Secreted protein n=1 Tax=Corynebacterium pyruviciproducens ATCC BAA-1742 TaxID=1125779 RepID=S2ZZB4_9CORY|nr:lipoprotein LpqH [Corynebacterium pyruviciproducens]EPD69449.1 hypothetical protein HMPREF1219_01322 [Corynebacterium pyruviciproducens ATCC BAA-1742]